ncbi:hypothetical protein H6801_00870 [Candidatus Nomurabacteria bacterium]|nr:hypothetical protein [Candidatus Nomurabacteria bacterium]
MDEAQQPQDQEALPSIPIDGLSEPADISYVIRRLKLDSGSQFSVLNHLLAAAIDQVREVSPAKVSEMETLGRLAIAFVMQDALEVEIEQTVKEARHIGVTWSAIAGAAGINPSVAFDVGILEPAKSKDSISRLADQMR